MSNNKFHFEFNKRTPKIFFPFKFKKEITLLLNSKVYHFYLFKKKFLNYNKCKLLIFTKNKKKRL